MFIACNEKEPELHNDDPSEYQGDEADPMRQDLTYRTHLFSKAYEENGKKKMEDITFSANILAAHDFLTRKGEKIDPNEMEDLKKETVVILEFELAQKHKRILESKSIEMSKDGTIEYLVGEIINDVSIFQDGKTVSPNGHQYENSFGKQNKTRVYFFFKNIDKNKELRITYHDKLFGAGLINFSMNKNFDI